MKLRAVNRSSGSNRIKGSAAINATTPAAINFIFSQLNRYSVFWSFQISVSVFISFNDMVNEITLIWTFDDVENLKRVILMEL